MENYGFQWGNMGGTDQHRWSNYRFCLRTSTIANTKCYCITNPNAYNDTDTECTLITFIGLIPSKNIV